MEKEQSQNPENNTLDDKDNNVEASPEINNQDAEKQDIKEELAEKSSAEKILDKIVTLENIATEKYGRVLADIITPEGLNINQWLIEEGHAKPYDGGKKDTDWPIANISSEEEIIVNIPKSKAKSKGKAKAKRKSNKV